MTPPLYDELHTRGIGLLMKMSSVRKSYRGRKPTLTENGWISNWRSTVGMILIIGNKKVTVMI
jgi:hypothetical protein